MLVDRSRDRLVNAIVYFARNTNSCGKTKLFKLLYLLDFEHFAQTGRSVTGSDYWAWEMGPVPASLAQEWAEFGDDLAKAVAIEHEQVGRHVRYSVRPCAEFDDAHFTPRQLRLLREIAEKFKHATADQMVAIAHEPGGPWDRTYKGGQGKNAPIDYALALAEGAPHREAIIEAAANYRALAQ